MKEKKHHEQRSGSDRHALKIADKLDIIELLVRQVSALVATTADVVEVSSRDTFAIEAWLYRNLEVNCRQKANRAEEEAAEQKQRLR